ncbi:hypothetical protein HZA26_00020 [Candidatus Nomurabacteria bacterium]|nr:hypothetical protein [Candidatus Nomurabacteria bacterium]
MNAKQSPSEFSTKDIYLSSVLKAFNVPIIKVLNSGRHGVFVFKYSRELENLISQFFNDELKVNPRTLFESWKTLKSTAFSTINDVR